MPKKLFIHTHHISSHFTNGLVPVGALLLISYFITGKQAYESASFYCLMIGAIAGPAVFFSGFLDWWTRFQHRPTQIFNHKRIFGVLFMVTSVGLVVWRFMDPGVAAPTSGLRNLYLAAYLADTGFVAYLGHLGGKFI